VVRKNVSQAAASWSVATGTPNNVARQSLAS
jgi:hypothetical protein